MRCNVNYGTTNRASKRDDTVISRALMIWQANRPRAGTLIDFA